VVTNKWLKAGYGEEVRALFSDPRRAELTFLADFGHAKHFFPDADVFPSLIVIKRPNAGSPRPEVAVCVIPRDGVLTKNLASAVEAATFRLPRGVFTRESWALEPKPVMDLLDKIRRKGVPLTEYAGGKPFRGVLTGFNEAFLVDTPTRDRLVAADPECAAVIKPYLRGQDVRRWVAEWNGLWMIFARRGIQIERYPSLLQHLRMLRDRLEPRPGDWQPTPEQPEWNGRKEGHYAWYEIQDGVDYWPEFEKPKIIYQEIQYTPSYAFDTTRLYSNNKTFVIASTDLFLLAVLNSPLMWWFNWRHLPHMKDEALSPMGFRMQQVPIASPDAQIRQAVENATGRMIELARDLRASAIAIQDWLRSEFGLNNPGRRLEDPARLDADGFVGAVKVMLPRRRSLTVTEIARLKQEYSCTLGPAREAALEAAMLERGLSDLVNVAYGLMPEDVRLMRESSPPRMPLTL